MTKFKTKHKAHALRKTGAAVLITAALLPAANRHREATVQIPTDQAEEELCPHRRAMTFQK